MEDTNLIKPLIGHHYPTVSHGNGVYLYDTEGKRYLDGCSGAVTACIGHGVDEIVEAMTAQAKKAAFVYRSQFTNEPAEKLAKKLSQLSNHHLNWAFFVNSGTEATETAMKIAIQHWQEKGKSSKIKILSRWMSYHGITIGALSLSGHPLRRARFVPLLEDCPSIPAPYCYRCPFQKTFPACELVCARELENVIKRTGADYIAAFIAEPIVGAAGAAITPPEGYYERLMEICRKYEVLFIADEVMTGMGRTGKTFAYEHWRIKPDIITLGKGLSAGYTPIAATLASDKVMEPIINGSKLIMSGHTLSANPLSAATALAVINYMTKHQPRVAEKGGYLEGKLKKLQKLSKIIGDVRGKGLLLGVELVENKQAKKPFSREVGLTGKLVELAQQNGLLIYPAAAGTDGMDGDAVIIAPPYTISNQEIDELVEKFQSTVQKIEQDLLL